MQDTHSNIQLYLSHRAALIDYATPMVGCRARAEDVVQEAYFRFMPRESAPGQVQQPIAYLYRIVRNLAFDISRRQQMEARHDNENPAYWTTPAPVRTPEQELMHEDELRRVNEVLAGLGDDARIAVEMHRFGGYSMQEIADHLGISVTSAHRLIKTAIVSVAGCLMSSAR